jgi:imidazolonepropionase-like amidohydrolase
VHRQRPKLRCNATAYDGVHNSVEAGIDKFEHGDYISESDIKLMLQYVCKLRPQEIVDVAGQEEEAANLMVGLSGSGMLFESVSRGNESYALSDGPAQTDRDNGWGIYYKPNSNPVTFAFEVFDSSYCCLLGCAC